ncbi:Serine/threonine-protein kinase PknF [Thalassocella blandensis]|nr:Serine/threonine-protein kinase PknF [Thalassocella blandensis]
MAELPNIPGYTIGRKLGRGGMATVYLAVQESMGRDVALKIMASHLVEDNHWAKRFIHEAKVIAQLSHPSIVPVYDVGTHQGQFFISMEYMHGGSLKERMTRLMPIPEVLKIVAGVAAGLDYAGEKGFVHRDIKPDNIMFREDGSPLILDFGIVKQVSDEASGMTQTGVIVGTTAYMSPEQAQGRDLDGRSDIYALGVMLYEMLTGSPPFKAETEVATLLQHINDDPPPLPDDLRELQPVIDKALAKDPDERYSRAREMIDHLEQLESDIKEMLTKRREGLPGEPTKAKPAVDDEATMIVGNTSRSTPVTTEEELTAVLSSAKATIKVYSAEARAKKARRNKRTITTVSAVAVCAVLLLGYHQLIVVPQERALAEQKIKEAEMKAQVRIEELLASAAEARRELSTSDDKEAEKVINAYREILQLDPDNQQAKDALQSFGERYLLLAQKAVAMEDVEKAETYREYAQQLIPRHPEIALLSNAIKDARATLLNQEFKSEEVKALIRVAEKDIEAEEGFSDAAYTKLQQALALDPDNRQAKKMIRAMMETTYAQTERYIEQGRVTRAKENLEILHRYYDEPERLIVLDENLRQTSERLSAQQHITSLLKKASRLEREKRSTAVNEELRSTYLSVLGYDKNNQEALRGMAAVNIYDLNTAQQAITERDFIRAEQYIRLVEKNNPKHAKLPAVKKQLATARQNVDTVDELIVSMTAFISSQKQGEAKRKDLKQAITIYAEAEKLDPNNPQLKQTLQSLESEYVSHINQLIAAEDKDLLDDYFTDAARQAWPTDRILQLQLSQKKTKPKRVITGGF